MTCKIYKSLQAKQKVMDFYDRVLSLWPDVEKIYVDTAAAGKTFVLACGSMDLPPLFLLHGSCANALVWKEDAALLSRHFRVYMLDIPGEPGKSQALRPTVGSMVYSDWLCELVEYFNCRKVNLIGNSLGGVLALEFASDFPEKVNQLGLIAPGGIVQVRVSFLFWMLCLMFGKSGRSIVAKKIFGGVVLDAAAREFSDCIFENFIPRRDQFYLSDEKLAQVYAKTLILIGENDVLYDYRKMKKRVARLMPAGRVKVLSGQGHALFNIARMFVEFFCL